MSKRSCLHYFYLLFFSIDLIYFELRSNIQLIFEIDYIYSYSDVKVISAFEVIEIDFYQHYLFIAVEGNLQI